MTSGIELAVNARNMYLVGTQFLLREMFCFLVFICSLTLVLAHLSHVGCCVGLAWDSTRGGGTPVRLPSRHAT